MLHQNIRDRFSMRDKSAEWEKISDKDWNDWRWQMKFRAGNVTPFASTQDSKLLAAQILLQNSTDELYEIKEQDGYTKIYFPLISMIPQRIDEDFITDLKNKSQVIFHFSINHPEECTLELVEALSLLADNGFILNNHMTFLNGVNNNAAVVKELNLKLLMMRVRPYSIYLYEQKARKSEFFNVTRAEGIAVMESLRGWTSGLAVPHLLAQKDDKTFEAILPDYVKKVDGETFIFRNYKHMDYEYTN